MRELIIDGRQAPARAGEELPVEDPSLGKVTHHVPLGRAADAVAAVESARRAFDSGPWPAMGPRDRAAVLTRMAELLEKDSDLFTQLGVDEVGTPRRMSQALHAARPVEAWQDMVERGSRSLDRTLPPVEAPTPTTRLVAREPRGVVGAIVPWNCPHLTTVFKLAPALVTGNCVVLKPAPEAPSAALELGRLALEAGLPPGVLNVVTGGADVGEVLSTHPAVDMVSFTGSVPVGRRVAAACAATVKHVTLELGGKSAQLVLPDADVAAVAGRAMRLLVNSGQICTAESRLLLPEALHDEVVERVAAAFAAVRVGSAHDEATEMGPVVSAAQRDRVEGWIDRGRRAGATVVTGGGRPAAGEPGYYLEPTLFTDVTNSMDIAREEVFGPVLCVIRYSGDPDEGVRIVNDSPYGLIGSVWTRDVPLGIRLARRLRVGRAIVNDVPSSHDAPFGGYKQSGLGRELGQVGLEEYTEVKHLAWVAGT